MPSSACQKSADRKSTRLNSSHTIISYAVFCLKKNRPVMFHHLVRVRMWCRSRWPWLIREKEAGLTSLLAFFFNDTATTEIYTLSLHDALPIYGHRDAVAAAAAAAPPLRPGTRQ